MEWPNFERRSTRVIFGVAAVLAFLLFLPVAAKVFAPAPWWVGPAVVLAVPVFLIGWAGRRRRSDPGQTPHVSPWLWLAALVPLGLPVLAFVVAHALVHGSGAAKAEAGWISAIAVFAAIHLTGVIIPMRRRRAMPK